MTAGEAPKPKYPKEEAPRYSGRSADPLRVVEEIEDTLIDAGVPEDAVETLRNNDWSAESDDTWDWNDPRARDAVRRKFGYGDDLLSESPEPLLPGFGPDGLGENAQDDCGEDHPWICNSCGSEVTIGRTCSMSVCSRCAVAWCRDAAIPKTAKIRRVRKNRNNRVNSQKHLQKRHHQVISPPVEWWWELACAGLSLERAYEITDELVKIIVDEMRGAGVVVRHSYRGDDGEDSEFNPVGDDMGMWGDLIFHGKSFYGEDGVRPQLAWQPHYHCVIVSDYLAGDGFTDVVQAATGWLIHRITQEDGKTSIENDEGVAKRVLYTISHGDIVTHDSRNNQSQNWYVGYVHNKGGESDDHIRNSHSPHPADITKAEEDVHKNTWELLGLAEWDSECGRDLPDRVNGDALAEEIIRDLWPEHDVPDEADPNYGPLTDAVLHHVEEGTIQVDRSGGSVSASTSLPTRRSPTSLPGASNLPSAAGSGTIVPSDDDAAPAPMPSSESDDVQEASDHDHGDECGCDDEDACDGKLIPLGEARRQGFLDDDDWLQQAERADEALAADEEYDDDLPAWRAESPTGPTAMPPEQQRSEPGGAPAD